MYITQRDTVVLAALINSALISVLFLLSHTPTEALPTPSTAPKTATPILADAIFANAPSSTATDAIASTPQDEIDALLRPYIEEIAIQEITPSDSNVVQVAADAQREAPNSEEGYYTIQPGDNPWTIAKKTGVDYQTLLSLNHLNERSARNLQIGQKIRIRK